MTRLYNSKGEESSGDEAVEKSGMGKDVERPTDKFVRKRIRSIIPDSDSDGNDFPVPVAHSTLETTADGDQGSSSSFPTSTACSQDTEPQHEPSPEIHINPFGNNAARNVNPAPLPQAVLPGSNDDNGSRCMHTRGQKRPQLDGGCHGCGEEVSLVEREGGDAIECKGEGCETLWVCESVVISLFCNQTIHSL